MGFTSNLSNLTINIKEADTMEGIVFENPILVPEVSEYHAVQTGVTVDTQIPIIGKLGDMGHKHPGSCGVNTYAGVFPVSEKVWQPVVSSERILFCADSLPANLKFWKNNKIASKQWEAMDKPLEQFFVENVQQAVSRAIMRQADFGDKQAVAGTNFVTAGDVGLVTMLNGLWKQIFLDDAGAKKIKRSSITENTLSTFALQMALGQETGYKALTEVVRSISAEYYSASNEINITPDLWNNYIDFLKLKGGAYDTTMYTNGVRTLMFDGYKVNVRHDWKMYIEKYQKLTNTYVLPHRITFGDKNNMPVGTSDTQSFKSLDIFYDKISKNVIADVAWSLDSKILLEQAMTVAF